MKANAPAVVLTALAWLDLPSAVRKYEAETKVKANWTVRKMPMSGKYEHDGQHKPGMWIFVVFLYETYTQDLEAESRSGKAS